MKSYRNLTFIDFQNDFVAPNGALTFDNGKGDINLINRTQAFFNELPMHYFATAIVTYDTHFPKNYAQTEEGKTFPLHCAVGTKGWELAVDKNIINQKIPVVQYLRKSTYDMWGGSLDTVRGDICTQTKEVVLFGVVSDICVKAGISGWLKRGATVIVLEDLTRGIVKQTREVVQEAPFKKAIARGQLKITTSRRFLQQFQNERS